MFCLICHVFFKLYIAVIRCYHPLNSKTSGRVILNKIDIYIDSIITFHTKYALKQINFSDENYWKDRVERHYNVICARFTCAKHGTVTKVTQVLDPMCNWLVRHWPIVGLMSLVVSTCLQSGNVHSCCSANAANSRIWHIVGLISGQCRRRWPSIFTTWS